jgi:hypothetical protein
MTPDLGETTGTEPLEVLNELAREARNDFAVPSPAERSSGWAAVASRMRLQAARQRTYFRYSAAGFLAVATVVAVVVLLPALRSRSRPQPAAALAYEIRGGSVVEGGYLRESGSDGIKLRFGEGSEMAFKAGTRGRLRQVSGTGARIAIEHGQAWFRITPRREADWSVEVGPFVVNVKGTAFTVAWDAVTERLDLALEHGSVSVTGPVASGTVLLKGGQRLTVDLPRKETTITEAAPDGTWPRSAPPEAPSVPDTAAGAPRPALTTEEADGQPPLAPPRATRTIPEFKSGTRRGWAQAVAAGDWDRILADVDRAGVRPTLAQASSDELLALADAARYRRRTDLARAALLEDRRRFPGSNSALDAAYLLGRLAESGRGGPNEALQWYDTYLAGAPAGPYASEALGRKMMAINQLHGTTEARSLANEYLRRFANGSYAGAARALLLSP